MIKTEPLLRLGLQDTEGNDDKYAMLPLSAPTKTVLRNKWPHQQKIFESKALINVASGGIGTGKTEAIVIDMFNHAFRFRKSRTGYGQLIYVCAQSFDRFEELVTEKIAKLFPADLVGWTFNRRQRKLEVPSWGFQLVYSQADFDTSSSRRRKAEKKGADLSGFIILQADEIDREAWFLHMIARVRRFLGKRKEALARGDKEAARFWEAAHRCWVDFNPHGLEHWTTRWFLDEKSPNWQGGITRGRPRLMVSSVATTPETSVYGTEDIARMLQDHPLHEQERLIRGIPANAAHGALVYPDWTRLTDYPTSLEEIIVGLDPGSGEHPFGSVTIGVWKENGEHVFGVLGDSLFKQPDGTPSKSTVDALVSLARSPLKDGGTTALIVAPAEPACLAWMRKLGYPGGTHIVKAPYYSNEPHTVKRYRPVANSVAIVRRLLTRGDIKIDASAKNTINELQQYSYNEEGEFRKKVFDPHCLDALRYAIIYIVRKYNKDRPDGK